MLTKILSSTFAANSITKPGDSPVLKTPADFGLEYEDVSFQASDGVKLSGWLVKGSKDRVIIQSHFGAQASRSGYTPTGKGMIKAYGKEIEFLHTAKHLVGEGYSVLMYDFRNHGNSGQGTCEWITGGVEECKDVIAAVKFVSSHAEYADAQIGLLSFCMGANSTTYAFGMADGLHDCRNIRALIAVQPLTNADFLKAFGFSESKVAKANQINLDRGGKDLFSSCVRDVKSINVPTLLVQAKGDPWANFDLIQDYFDRLQVEKEMYWIEGTSERLASYDWFSHTPRPMVNFFNKHMKS